MEQLLRESSPLAAETLYGALVDGWLAGAAHTAGNLPAGFQPASILFPPASPPSEPPLPPPTAAAFFDDGQPPPGVSLTMIDDAIASLWTRRLMQPEEFHALAAEAKQQAFTVTADLTNESIAKFRAALAADVFEGPSLKSFREKVLEKFDTLPIAESHLEQVYRNNINEAFSQGMEQILSHPLVEDAFPYRQYCAIHDARCRPEHRELERLGLDGTAVYYRTDPTWLTFRPPWDFNCRCGWIAISIETAAGMGVKEAQEWLAAIEAAEQAGTYNGLPSSVEPPHVWVLPPPFQPPVGWRR